MIEVLRNAIMTMAIILIVILSVYVGRFLKTSENVDPRTGVEFKGIFIGNFEGHYFSSCDGEMMLAVTEAPDIEGLEVVFDPSYAEFNRYMVVRGRLIEVNDQGWGEIAIYNILKIDSITAAECQKFKGFRIDNSS